MIKKKLKLPHPGRYVRRAIQDRGISVYKVAKLCGIHQSTLNMVVNEKRGISMDVALRLAKLFGVRPQLFMDLQVSYDLRIREQEISKDDSYNGIQNLELVESQGSV